MRNDTKTQFSRLAGMKPSRFLDYLNDTYARLHEKYEELYWLSYMGDHSKDVQFKKSLMDRDNFRSDRNLLKQVQSLLERPGNSAKLQSRLQIWKNFFELFQVPENLVQLREEIAAIEQKISDLKTSRKEGYKDPKTGKFIEASQNKMRALVSTDPDESIRKAVFEALEDQAVDALDLYVEMVPLLNQYAHALGYEDFYAYKLAIGEGITKKELFSLWDEIYSKTKYGFKAVRDLEKRIPGLRKPWNFGYMMAGDFTKEEDPYFQFDDALIRWGKSFSAIGIDYRGGTLQLDLFDRKGKYNNGFCHYPRLVQFKNGKRIPGAANFTCNVVYGQLGSGRVGMETLFHEGGHAADRLNSELQDVVLSTEYPPASSAWAETQSMFLDTMFSSIEWRIRYAKNEEGQAYPFELYQRQVEKLGVLRPLGFMHMMMVSNFEKELYETKNLTAEKVTALAYKNYLKYTDRSVKSLSILNVPHIYKWESICYYQSYALAELSLIQWREYFYKKYGYIVDNPKVGKEMQKVWKLGSSKSFPEMVKIATGKKLSANDYIKSATRSNREVLKLAKKRLARMEKVSEYDGPIKLNAKIKIVASKKIMPKWQAIINKNFK